MLKKGSLENIRVAAQMDLSIDGVAYEEPYETVFNNETVLVLGHNNGEYVVMVNNQIEYVPAGDLF